MGMKMVHAVATAVLVLCCATMQVNAFLGGAYMPRACMPVAGKGALGLSARQSGPRMPMGMQMQEQGAGPLLGRRSVLAGLAVLPLAPVGRTLVGAAEEEAAAADADPEEVVVQGEMRLEEGTDAKFDKAGGKGTALVTLRVVGKGIIAEKKFSVEAADFPPAGKPSKGKEVGGGVPFIIKAKELREKTDKGRTVKKEGLWGDDDIFVRVDLLQGDSKKKIASGLGKAKYLFDTKTHQTSFVLLE